LRDHRSPSRAAYTLARRHRAGAIPALLPSSYLRSPPNCDPYGGLIQPGEFAKLALLSFAYYLRKRGPVAGQQADPGIDFPRGRDLGPVLVVWLLSLVPVEKDLGTRPRISACS
jgi:hypothetical protein